MDDEKHLRSVSELVGMGLYITTHKKLLSRPDLAPESVGSEWSYFFVLRSPEGFESGVLDVLAKPRYDAFVWIGPEHGRPTEIAVLCFSRRDAQTAFGEIIFLLEDNNQDACSTLISAEHLWRTQHDYFRRLLEDRFDLLFCHVTQYAAQQRAPANRGWRWDFP